jgi:hypothetical protein
MNTQYWFIESQTSAHFGIPRAAQMRLALNEPNRNRLHFIQIQTLPPRMHHHKWKENIDM